MKEKNIILTARIMSMLFTPFYLPLVGLVALFLFSYMSLLPLAYKLPMLLTVYLFTILLPSVLIHIYRRYQGWSTTELERATHRALHHLHRVLLWVLFPDGIPQHSPCHQHHLSGCFDYTDGVCLHQYMVEDIHPYSSHRRCGRSLTGLFYQFLVQPHLVALSGTHPGRHGRYSTNDTAPTQPVAGCNRILHRTRLRLPRHLRETNCQQE